jgi:hypothetical protein
VREWLRCGKESGCTVKLRSRKLKISDLEILDFRFEDCKTDSWAELKLI